MHKQKEHYGESNDHNRINQCSWRENKGCLFLLFTAFFPSPPSSPRLNHDESHQQQFWSSNETADEVSKCMAGSVPVQSSGKRTGVGDPILQLLGDHFCLMFTFPLPCFLPISCAPFSLLSLERLKMSLMSSSCVQNLVYKLRLRPEI